MMEEARNFHIYSLFVCRSAASSRLIRAHIMATSDVAKETLNVAGLSTNVYTRANFRDKRTSDSEPVVVLFFLHGRTESADQGDPTARAAFSWAVKKEASSREASRDFMVVTFVRIHCSPTEVE